MINVNDYGRTAGAEAAQHVLDIPHKPDGVFVIADQLAIGFMEALQQSGICVPDDIAVASFNNIPEAALCEPGLTTVAAPIESFGETSASTLMKLINGGFPQQNHIKIPCAELIIRESCGCET